MVYPTFLPLLCTPRLPIASILHTTPEHGLSSITTADAHTSAASSRLIWRPPADLNGLVRLAERLNLVSARVSSHFNWPVHSASVDTMGSHNVYRLSCNIIYAKQSKINCKQYGIPQCSHSLNIPVLCFEKLAWEWFSHQIFNIDYQYMCGPVSVGSIATG